MFKAILNINIISERRQKTYLINIPYKHILLTNLKVSGNKRKWYNIFMEIMNSKIFFSLESSKSYLSFNKTMLLLCQHFFLIISWIQSFFSVFPWSFLYPSGPLRDYCAISKNCPTLPFPTPGTWKVSISCQFPALPQLFPRLSSAGLLAPCQ